MTEFQLRTDPLSGTMVVETALGLIDGINDESHRCLLLSFLDGQWGVLRLADLQIVPAARITMVIDNSWAP